MNLLRFYFKSSTLFLLGLMAFLYSCQNNALDLRQLDSQVFETNFVPSNRFSGVYYDEHTEQEYIYLGNGKTEKSVSFFTSDGDYVKTIDFRQATISHSLNDISIWSLDTILLLSSYSGVIFFINERGSCFKKLNLNKYVPDTIPSLEFTSSKLDDFLYNESLYVGINLSPTVINDLSNYEGILKYNQLSIELPYLIKMSNIFDTIPRISFLLNAFIKNFIPKNHLALDIHHYLVLEDKIFSISIIPDTLYLSNISENKTIKKHIDYVEKTNIDKKRFELTKESISKIQENIFWQTQRASYISKILASENHKLKHLFAFHQFEGKAEDCWDKRNWSWLVYNEKFEKLNEFIMTDYSVSPTFSFLTQKGIFLKVKPKFVKNYDPKKTHFKIYTVD